MTDLDAERDAIALVRAVLDSDWEAFRIILDNGDLRAMAAELAHFAFGVTMGMERGNREHAEQFIAWWQQRMNEAERSAP